jgi:transcription antitermination factor NusG
VAVTQLNRLGVAAMSPRTRQFERVSRKKIRAFDAPLYPRYVIASATPCQRERMRNEVWTVHPVPLALGGRPYELPASQVDAVAALVANPPPDPRDPYPDGKPDPDAPPFRSGETVRVLSGPFAFFQGVVERVKVASRKWTVRVSVDIFGRPTPVDLDAGAVALA